MVDSVFMADLTWPEFEARTKAKAPFFLPVGATEQHGPHLPLGVDVILPTGVCGRVAKRVGGAGRLELRPRAHRLVDKGPAQLAARQDPLAVQPIEDGLQIRPAARYEHRQPEHRPP